MIKKTLKKQSVVSKKDMKKPAESCHASHASAHHSGHPSHAKDKKRLSKIKGQIEGVDRMIDEGRYCLDIIYQIRAASSALKALEKEIMYTHVKSCVKNAIESKDHYESQEKIEEIMNFF